MGNISGNIIKEVNVNGNISKASTLYIEELYFANRYEFPNLGAEKILYIAKDEKASYIFNTDNLTYVCIGRDYEEIDTIQSIL